MLYDAGGYSLCLPGWQPAVHAIGAVYARSLTISIRGRWQVLHKCSTSLRTVPSRSLGSIMEHRVHGVVVYCLLVFPLRSSFHACPTSSASNLDPQWEVKGLGCKVYSMYAQVVSSMHAQCAITAKGEVPMS